VEIAFETKELRAICCFQTEAEEIFGTDKAKQLRGWLADARAADNLDEFFCLREVSNEHGVMNSSCGNDLIVKFDQAHLNPPKINGCLDFTKVYRIKILSIGGGTSGD
jgi:hypothetical protein